MSKHQWVMGWILTCAVAVQGGGAWAQGGEAKKGAGNSEPVFADAPPPPAIPGPITERDLVEPEVVIRQEGDQTITEYRVGGRVYMMKVVPARGEPYYLIDKSGGGTFERLPGGAPLSPPMWVIKSWK